MWLIVISCFCLVQMVLSSCWIQPIKVDITEYGRPRFYCEYRQSKGDSPLKVIPGSRFETLNCESCSCTNTGLECCGVGIFAGVFGVPDECEVVADGCTPILVLKADNDIDCMTRQPIAAHQYGLRPNGLFAPLGNNLPEGLMPAYLPPPPPPKNKPMFKFSPTQEPTVTETVVAEVVAESPAPVVNDNEESPSPSHAASAVGVPVQRQAQKPSR